MTAEPFDLLILGSGPAGVQAALRAAETGRRAAIVEKQSCVGGVCLHTGTIPSKTLRQGVLDLTGYATRGLYHTEERHPRVTMELLAARCREVIAAEVAFTERLLGRRGVAVIPGQARFLDAHTVRVDGPLGRREVRARRILIAVGTGPDHLPWVPFDGLRVLDSDQVLTLAELPRSLAIVGGGVIGSEYASIYSLLEMEVSLVNRGAHILSFLDEAMVSAIETELTDRHGVRILANATVERIEKLPDRVRTVLGDGRVLETEALLFCAGRRGAVADLDLPAAGLSSDPQGRIRVDERFRTEVPHIYAAGDVIGFPSLASASREQGRVAAAEALAVPCRPISATLPFGIYTIPEIAMVGPSEAQARGMGLDVVVGLGRFADTARGQIVGDTTGLLKLIVDRRTRHLIGVHIFGSLASELVHLGQMAIEFHATCDFFLQSVMNYPTLSRAYKIAAYEVMERL